MSKKQEIKSKLLRKPGYLKWSPARLSERYNAPEGLMREVMAEVKNTSIPGLTGIDRKLFKEFLDFKAKKTPKSKQMVVKPSPKPYKGNKDNVLIIGDLHEPFTQDGYLEHCREVQERFDCGTVVFIGDIVDNHATSFHEHDPEGYSAGHEYLKAISKLERWYKTFPTSYMCIGNHDQLPFRQAFKNGLPSSWLKGYNELFKTPETWKIDFNHTINGVNYTHGTGVSGDAGAMKIANQNRQSSVIGHLHSVANIKYSASYKDIIFAMTVGCGVNYREYAFNYGRDFVAKPIVSCGIVIDGKIPVLIPMAL